MRGRALLGVACLCAVALGVIGMSSVGSLAWRERAITREAERSTDDTGRYCDMGIVLRVVERDEANGQTLVDGVPPMRVVREHRLGGMVDLWGEGNDGKPCLCGPSENPTQWVCSLAQESLILHNDDQPLWTLIQGSEGSGKTYALGMWTALRVLEHVGHDREIGLTAPINRRMEHIRKAITKLWPRHWYAWKEAKREYHFRAGPIVALASAHSSRKDEGSPIQGANWVAHGGDELQDHFDKEDDIVMRGRAAPHGRYKRLNTSTAKESAAWRTFRGVVEQSPVWRFARVLGMENPLVPPAHWARLRAGGMTQREWDRRVLALDVAPEAQLYHCWARKLADGSPANLRPIPLGAVDVTAEVMRPWQSGRPITVLVGHDPGKRQHVSMFLKAYRIKGRDPRPWWFVVDEITTPDATIQRHVTEVLARARDHWNCNRLDYAGRPDADCGELLVRIDPHSQGESEDHTARDVYTVWRSAGIAARAAAYKPGSTQPGRINRGSRFNMMNTLLCDVNDLRRLHVLVDDDGRPAAPKLVNAFESMERNAEGKGETEKKNADDVSHWPAAVGYALWQIESPRMTAATPAPEQAVRA